jgi:hypothetical protein
LGFSINAAQTMMTMAYVDETDTIVTGTVSGLFVVVVSPQRGFVRLTKFARRCRSGVVLWCRVVRFAAVVFDAGFEIARRAILLLNVMGFFFDRSIVHNKRLLIADVFKRIGSVCATGDRLRRHGFDSRLSRNQRAKEEEGLKRFCKLLIYCT